MLKDLTTIKFSGANFTETTELTLFKPSYDKNNKEITTKGSILYGRNGSGKSTIARVFKKLVGEESPIIIDAEILDKNKNQIELTEEEKEHIFVFDEEFVDKNVKFQEDHLDTIVMLGPAADLSEKIKIAEEEEKIAREESAIKEKKVKEYNDPNCEESPGYYQNKITEILREDESWAERDRKIRGNSIKTSIRANYFDQLVEQIVNAKPTKARASLLSEFQEKLQNLEKARTGATVIPERVPILTDYYTAYNDMEIQRLLAEKIERPELTEREKKLIGIKANELNDRLSFFKNSETTQCPYCFQALSADYKNTLVSGIEKELNKAVEEHQKKLLDRDCREISIN